MSLFICPTHGLHHGPFCCDEPQTWWDGTFCDQQPTFTASVDTLPEGGKDGESDDATHA